MPSTLVLTGSLALNRVTEMLIKYQKSEITIIEFDTTINKLLYPWVFKWTDINKLLLANDKELINKVGVDFLDCFLNFDFKDKRVPLHRNFIGSCINFEVKAFITSFLINIEVYKKIKGLGAFDQYVIIPGNGINIQAWQAIAKFHNAPIEYGKRDLCVIPCGRKTNLFLNRISIRNLKLFSRKRNKNKCISEDILCVGSRIASVLSNEDNNITSKCRQLSDTEISKTDNRKILFNQNIYSEIWGNLIRNNSLVEFGSELEYFDSVLFKEVGDIFFNKIFPNKSIIYSNAINVIAKLRPRLVACTTQLGANERMWSLGARELGVCVVAYSYDGIFELQNAVSTDYLLCGNRDIAKAAMNKGFSPEKILMVQSHRRLSAPISRKIYNKKTTRVVLADTFFAGLDSSEDPLVTYLSYKLLIQAAKICSDIEFFIKFHPLRGKKKQNLAWSGFDEGELLIRKKYIKNLYPPSNVKTIEPECKLGDIIGDFDVLINLNSFAAIEAFEVGVPVIFLFFNELLSTASRFNSLIETGGLLSADNSNEICKILQMLLKNKHYRNLQINKQYKYITEYMYESSPRSLDVLVSLLEKY